MKKLLFMLPLLAVLSFSSCEGPMGPEGPAGRDGEDGNDGHDGVVYYQKDEFEVLSDNWQLVENGDEKFYQYSFEYSELTEDMCDIGVVTASLIWDSDDNTYQSPLPCVRHHAEEGTDGLIYYTTTIDCEYGPGVITFYVTNSDFYIDDKPETMYFRVCTHY